MTLWIPRNIRDPSLDAKTVMEEIRATCSVRDIDLFVYCMRFDQTRLAQDDVDCIRDFTKACGDGMWKRALIALTFANTAIVPSSANTSLQEYFQARESKWKEALCRVIKESVNPAEIPATEVDNIPIVATGYRDELLPDGRNWYADFWSACLSQVNLPAFSALMSVVRDRVQGAEGHRVVAKVIGERYAKVGDHIEQELQMQRSILGEQFARGITYTWDYLRSSVFSLTGIAARGAATSTSITPVQNPSIIGETSGSQGIMHACIQLCTYSMLKCGMDQSAIYSCLFSSTAVDVVEAPNVPSVPTPPEQARGALIATSVNATTSNGQGDSQCNSDLRFVIMHIVLILI